MTELTVATAAKAEEMREAMGLKSSATRDVGTATGTVAAGDDLRILGAVRFNSDQSSSLTFQQKMTARKNLGAVSSQELWLQDFGAALNGMDDDHEALVDAINAAAAIGGASIRWQGYLRNNSYIVPTPGQSNINLVGSGSQNSLIYNPDHAFTHFVLSADNTGWAFERMGFFHDNGGVGPDAAYLVDSAGRDTQFYDVWASGYWRGFNTRGGVIAARGVRLKNGKAGSGIGWVINQGPNEGCYLDDIEMENDVSSNAYAGVQVLSGSDIQLRNSGCNHMGVALRVEPGNGQIVASLVLDNFGADNSSGDGMRLVPSGTGVIQRVRMSNCWSSSNGVVSGTGRGLLIASSGVGQVDIATTKMLLNNNEAIYYSGAGGLTLTASTLSGNGSHGFIAEAGAKDFTVLGNTIGSADGVGPNGGYGVYVAPGASDGYVIALNRFPSNTGGMISDGGTGTNKEVQTLSFSA